MNIAEHVTGAAHESVTVHVTVTLPPQKSGPAGDASFAIVPKHPPEKVASVAATHAVKAASI